MDPTLRFVMATLAVWRLTHALAHEDGPWDVFRALRRRTAGTLTGRLVSCFYCLSVWIALPFGWFVAAAWVEAVVAWWALSGAAIVLERVTARAVEINVGASDDELLRPDERASDD